MTLVAALLPACRRRAVLHEPGTTARFTALDTRVDVILGRTLVMPVALNGTVNPARPIRARLDDGRPLAVSLFWISVAPDLSPQSTWLQEPGRWTATPAAASIRPAGAGWWAIVADLPPDAIGQGLWLGSDRTSLNWLPSPAFVRSGSDPVDWSSPVPDLIASPSLVRLAAPEARSPGRRWRHRLLMGSLAPDDDPLIKSPTRDDLFTDPTIEALARQIEGRWQVALASLWIADPEVAGKVKQRLACIVNFGRGTFAPAWPAAGADLDVLLADLLNVRLQPQQQVERARAWLDTQPPAAAWVIDDAGQRDAPTGLTLASIGCANLTDHDAVGWTTAEFPNMVPLMCFTAWTLTASAAPTETTAPVRPTSPGTQIDINAGKWSTTRSVMLSSIPALPPGLRLEPFRRDWDMAMWLGAGVPPRTEESWSGAGMLYLNASDNTWNLYVECRSPTIGGQEAVRIWIGAFNAPSSVIRVTSTGEALDELAARQNQPSTIKGAAVSRQGDTWTARIPIPARCIEQDGTLRIGLHRTDALGRGSAWPRPMLPWQTEPGRIAVDTTAWARLGGAGATGLAGPGRVKPASSTR